ncbi:MULTISPECIES: hypothetical protein [Enterobacterales]|jgi:hypothetical protein|nr:MULTISPECIES: hypothetical protein [Enterobacterales]
MIIPVTLSAAIPASAALGRKTGPVTAGTMKRNGAKSGSKLTNSAELLNK